MRNPDNSSLRGGHLFFPTKQSSVMRRLLRLKPKAPRSDMFIMRTKLFAFAFILSILVNASIKPALAYQIDVPLDRALVYSGGESTNLREYDPATTYSSGNKLVFSGLVSFDPYLARLKRPGGCRLASVVRRRRNGLSTC